MTFQAGQTSLFNVREHGAIGNGQTLDSRAIQSVIDACAARGGGTVTLPAGQYLTGSLFLRNNITLQLEAGAVLLGSENPEDYPVIHSRWEGRHQDTHAPLIGGNHLQNIAVTGRGTIDGRGAVWWQAKKDKTLAHPRPRLISFSDCSNVLIEGITAINSPSWTINPVHCHNVNIHAITILNPADSPNTDGINPDSCRLVRISDCYVSVGDDCITIKSGTEHEHPDRYAPCRDITITNCTLERGHGGVVIGSEMSGGVKNVVISNCVFIGTDRGIRIKSRRGRGGTIEDIRVSNLIMDGVLCPFTMNLYYHIGERGNLNVSDKNPRSVDDGTPRLRHIHFSHITAREVKHAAGFLYGLAEMPLEDISLSDISISISDEADSGYPEMADDIPSMSQAGFFIRNVHHLRLEHVEVTGQRGPVFDIDNSTEVEIIPAP
ncbi:MAG: glycoside hydrolase family 28 protein [Chloroflexi bacterium]|nr:MAG: glycoside hydrolase family 28 protein [Chloroflexota bacterium]